MPFKLYGGHRVATLHQHGVRLVVVEVLIGEQTRIRKNPEDVEALEFVLPAEHAKVFARELLGAVDLIEKQKTLDDSGKPH